MAASSSFSYAQAAKGRAASPSSNPTDTPQQAQDSPSAPPVANSTTAEAPVVDSSDKSLPAPAEKQELDGRSDSQADTRSESVQERRSESRREDDSERLNRPWRRNDKGTRSSSATTRSVDEHESRKPRRGKKGKASEKQAAEQAAEKEAEPEPEPPKVELSEAPIPTVNPWLQRKEAQLAKSRVPSLDAQADGSNGAPKNSDDTSKDVSAHGETSESSPAREVSLINGAKPTRRAGEAPRPERNGSRGSRTTEKDGKPAVPPPVEDAALWPTPENATVEDKKKGQDKADRPELIQDDSAGAKPKQKKEWLTYDYVPSVSFETQLPNLRGSKPRGGAKGASAPRASVANQAGDKLPSPTTTGKMTEARERPRDGTNGTNGVAQSSQQGKRPSVDGPGVREPRKAGASSATDRAKEPLQGQSAEQSNPPRERHEGRHEGRGEGRGDNRGEGRGERGRGGYRGRGNHHFVNSHTQHQGLNAGPGYSQNGGAAQRAQGPYSPPSRQGSNGQQYVPSSQRGGRGGRHGGNGNYHRMSVPNGAPRPAPVQTQYGTYDYSMPPMSAMSYQPAPPVDNVLLPYLRSQVEYYFSIENLCKDLYLRRRMDSQGFVPLHFVAAFKRMRQLTGDLSLIRLVCEDSAVVELVVGDDDVERLRPRENFDRWVLPMAGRDELARNAGPRHFTHRNRTYHFSPPYNGVPMHYGLASPPAFAMGGDYPYPQFMEEPQNAHSGHDANAAVTNGHSQLSADVPDFSPSGPAKYGQQDSVLSHLDNGAGHAPADANGINGYSNGAVPNGMSNGVHHNEGLEQGTLQS
ncbi:hypothetical protein S40285_05985 [Stachybotrys chlorohalonatus IBT 40285]|uniref:HTH La-type RNA-binding domain-containing protein n=1 Tax=Stachybotrys chlorohalonatus (strain IBT 40285) TaxID=1283841 RepID=A0A084QBH7_STAC4|nr:hypothetical protein S40285_05985 [Stachybotrys chlorohalonata IBT 40285]